MIHLRMMALTVAGLTCWHAGGDQPSRKSAREALQALGALVGEWRGTGVPAGTREEQNKNFWTETMAWQWKFKGKDAWLDVTFKDSKYFVSGELRYLPDKDHYELQVKTTDKQALTFAGPLKDKVLTLDREAKDETQRLVFNLLHDNRFLYRSEVQQAGKSFFARRYQVGATKEGVPFAAGDGRPECIVTGGLGTIAVTHKGQTYYVCCSGCRDEFRDNPEKYIKEYQEKKAKKK